LHIGVKDRKRLLLVSSIRLDGLPVDVKDCQNARGFITKRVPRSSEVKGGFHECRAHEPAAAFFLTSTKCQDISSQHHRRSGMNAFDGRFRDGQLRSCGLTPSSEYSSRNACFPHHCRSGHWSFSNSYLVIECLTTRDKEKSSSFHGEDGTPMT
jgi:hypothetical protein